MSTNAQLKQQISAVSGVGEPDRPSCSPRTCPAWISWRSWSTACISASTPAWSLSGSTSTSTSTAAKHPLSLVEGSTENATLVTELIVGLRERGLDVTRPILAVLDGSKALRRAVLDVFDRPVIGRCQLHKIRNVQDHLPEKLRTTVASRMRRAYHADSALAAEAELCALAAELDRTHPGAAASLREGMAETLTVLRLNIPPTLARTLRSTNAVESMISICRTHTGNVKNWRDGQMALRWCAAGMVEAGKQFRRINGHLHLPALRAALEREVSETVGPLVQDELVNVA